MGLRQKTLRHEKGGLISLQEAAEIIGCSVEAIRKGIILIPLIYLTDSEKPLLRVRRLDVDKFLDQRIAASLELFERDIDTENTIFKRENSAEFVQ